MLPLFEIDCGDMCYDSHFLFDDRQSGEILSRITQDTNIVKALITQHLITFVTGLITIIGSIIFLLLIDWKMTVIMLISIPLSILFILPLGQKCTRLQMLRRMKWRIFLLTLVEC